jgi:hypothetical protein
VSGLEANRQLDGGGVEHELVAQLLDDDVRVGAFAVQLVDECHARHLVALHLPIDGDRLRLDARDTAQHEDGAIEHAQRALHLDRKVDVPRRVDDVDLVVAPVAVRRRRLNGDALFAFEGHRVHLRADAVFAAHLVDLTDASGEVKDALGERRLARVNVCGDANVAQLLHAVHAGHRGRRSRERAPKHPRHGRRKQQRRHAARRQADSAGAAARQHRRCRR